MVMIKHSGDNQDRIHDILNAAQKRFGIYGAEKTTMTEIAADLNLSKGSLYYYFPDKDQLYKAVVKSEHNEFLEQVKLNIGQMKDPCEMFHEFVRVNFQFYRKLLNLSRVRLSEIDRMKPCIQEMIHDHRQQEAELLSSILQKGMDLGVLSMKNPYEVAFLFIELMKGLRQITIRNKEFFYLEEDEYNALYIKGKLFAEIYVNGLKIKN